MACLKEAVIQLMGLGTCQNKTSSKNALMLKCCGEGRDPRIKNIIPAVHSGLLKLKPELGKVLGQRVILKIHNFIESDS